MIILNDIVKLMQDKTIWVYFKEGVVCAGALVGIDLTTEKGCSIKVDFGNDRVEDVPRKNCYETMEEATEGKKILRPSVKWISE